jgi:hypothetical protein
MSHKRKNDEAKNTSVKVALITAVAAVMAAIIGKLPTGSGGEQKDLGCNYPILFLIYNCGYDNTINVGVNPTQDTINQTVQAIEKTQTAIAIPSSTPTAILALTETAIVLTQTAIAQPSDTITPPALITPTSFSVQSTPVTPTLDTPTPQIQLTRIVVTATPASENIIPTSINSAASLPSSKTNLTIYSNRSPKVFLPTYQCGADGVYKVTIEDGAYTANLDETLFGWRSILIVYVGGSVKWSETTEAHYILNPQPETRQDASSVELGEWNSSPTEQEAVDKARGMSKTVNCRTGENIYVVPVDIQNKYGDNKGEMTVSIQRVS